MRKKKMDLSDMFNANIQYYDYTRTGVSGVRGYAYKIDKALSEAQRDFINKFKNTRILGWRAQYAPELGGEVLFVGDKCFK